MSIRRTCKWIWLRARRWATEQRGRESLAADRLFARVDRDRVRRWTRSIFRWEALTALATFGLLVVTGIYIPFFSELPKVIEQASKLNTDNGRLLEQNQEQQKNSQAAIARYLEIQNQINRALQEQIIAQREVASLSDELQRAHGNLDQLERSRRALSQELISSNNTLRQSVDTTIELSYSARYAAFLAEFKQMPFIIIPTSEVVPDNEPYKFYYFLFLDKHANFIEAGDETMKHAFDAGPIAIIGMAGRIDVQSGMNFGTEQIDPTDPIFKRFITVITGEADVDPATYLFVSQQYNLPLWHWKMRDLIEKLVGSKPAFGIGLVPGQIGDMAWEEPMVRGFWISAVGHTFSEMSGIGNVIEKKMPKAISTNTEGLVAANIQMSSGDMAAMSRTVEKKFGPEGFKYFKERLQKLDKIWLAALDAESLEIDLKKAFVLSKSGRLKPILKRWDPAESDKDLAGTFLQDIEMDWTLRYDLSCSAARFLHDNNISSGPDTLTVAAGCERSKKMDEGMLKGLAAPRDESRVVPSPTDK
jgi:hypothetical protein